MIESRVRGYTKPLLYNTWVISNQRIVAPAVLLLLFLLPRKVSEKTIPALLLISTLVFPDYMPEQTNWHYPRPQSTRRIDPPAVF